MGYLNLLAFWVCAFMWSDAVDKRRPLAASWLVVCGLANFACWAAWCFGG